ncbi:SusC/RagA family TonB-linked outer membrane protein [Hymenobacter nivis]|nr:SusC/RagA family TonB-linked outer membrane protein [Hymenobacter nivis]
MKQTLLLFVLLLGGLLQQAQAQNRTVSGKITDRATGQGLPGVTVIVKGRPTVGTTSNSEGAFVLNDVPADASALVFSFVGFATQEQPITGGALNVALATDAKQLSEVVVTALGLQANRDQLGTAQATVQGAALVSSGETSVVTGISGKTPGVLITRSSGDPGASANIQIRGAATITGNLQPLIVVDGIPISNSSIGNDGILTSNGGAGSNQTNGVVQASRLNDINPDDIASMEVLKGAAAAALWGTRAANGVIVITTKKGKLGDRMHIAVRSTFSFDRINKTPALQLNYGQGAGGLYKFGSSSSRSWGDYIGDRTGAADAQITDPTNPAYKGFVTFPDGSTQYAIANGTAANPHGGKNSQQTYDHGRDVFGTGYYRDNSIEFSGGDEKSTYFLSGSNTYTKGIVYNNSDNNRTTIRANVTRNLSDKFSSAVNVTYARTFSNRVQQGSNVSGIFLGGLRSPADYNNSQYIGDYTDKTGALIANRQVTYRNPLGAGNPGYDNPNFTINRITNTSLVNRLVGSTELNYHPTDWLSFLNRTGVDTYTDRREAFFPRQSAANLSGALTEEYITETQVNNDFIVRANHSFSENFSISAIVGNNLNERRADQVGASATNIVNVLSPPQLDNSPANTRVPYNIKSVIRTAAVYGEVDVSLLDQFYLTGTLRGESASTFGPSTKSTFYFPSGTFAWQFTKIPAFANNAALSFGKLRVAYGQVGVQPGIYQTQTYYVPGSGNFVDGFGPALDVANYGGGYIRSTVQGNPFLKPERKSEVETGLDLRFLKDRISFSATYYNNKTTAAILQVSTPYTTGYSSQWQNAATITNKGIELQLDGAIIKTADFGFNLAANFSQNKNNVADLAGVQSVFLNGFSGNSINSVAIKDHQLGTLYGSRFARTTDGTNALALDPQGFAVLAATNGVVGDPNPQWRGGLGATLRYKGLSLYALLDHVHSFDVWNGTRSILNTFGTSAITGTRTTLSAADAAATKTFGGGTVASKVGQNAAYVLNADGSVTFRGTVNNFGGGPVALDEDWYSNGAGSGFGGAGEQYVEHVNTTRLREVTLSYSLNSAAFRDATKLQSIDFSLTGRNIYLWTNYSGVDPETNLTGVSNGRGLDYFNNPSTRSVLFSVRLTY